VHKAKELQYHTKMINSGRYVNDSMGRYIGNQSGRERQEIPFRSGGFQDIKRIYPHSIENNGKLVHMGRYIGKKVVKKIISQGKNILGAHVLVMGMTFKENVSDIRNSKVK